MVSVVILQIQNFIFTMMTQFCIVLGLSLVSSTNIRRSYFLFVFSVDSLKLSGGFFVFFVKVLLQSLCVLWCECEWATVKVIVPLVLHIGKNESNKLNSVWSSFNECFMLSILSHLLHL